MDETFYEFSSEASLLAHTKYGSKVKPVSSGYLNRTPNIGYQDQLSLNAAQKYCRILQHTFDLH